jgi:uncharacterized protein (TIGR00725 family)
MGPGEEATTQELANAYDLGRLLAEDGWTILSGGRDAGVMREVNRGAKSVPGSLTVGILPSESWRVSEHLDVVIITEMHNARNNINVLSSHVVIACGSGGPGTVSEIALALKAGRPVILLGADELTRSFFVRLGGDRVRVAESPDEAARTARQFRPE